MSRVSTNFGGTEALDGKTKVEMQAPVDAKSGCQERACYNPRCYCTCYSNCTSNTKLLCIVVYICLLPTLYGESLQHKLVNKASPIISTMWL